MLIPHQQQHQGQQMILQSKHLNAGHISPHPAHNHLSPTSTPILYAGQSALPHTIVQKSHQNHGQPLPQAHSGSYIKANPTHPYTVSHQQQPSGYPHSGHEAHAGTGSKPISANLFHTDQQDHQAHVDHVNTEHQQQQQQTLESIGYTIIGENNFIENNVTRFNTTMGKNNVIRHGSRFFNVTMGSNNNIYIFVDMFNRTKIGDNNTIWLYCNIHDEVHIGNNTEMHPLVIVDKSVVIENGASIGGGCYLGPGVIIKEGAYLNASLIVHKKVIIEKGEHFNIMDIVIGKPHPRDFLHRCKNITETIDDNGLNKL